MENRAFSRVLLAALVAAVGLLAWQARGGAGAPAPAPVTVAVVDMVQLVEGLNETNDRDAARKVRLDAYEKQVDQAVQEMKVAEDDYKQMEKPDMSHLGDPAYKAKKLKWREAEAVAKMRLAGLSTAKEIEKGDLVAELYRRAIDTIAQVAAAEGYDLVLLNDAGIQLPQDAHWNTVFSAITARKVLFHASRLDITKQVIARMNNDYDAIKGKQ